MPSLRIDVVSDVVCPWCLIGTRRLELALAELPELEATVTYRPFMLEPGAPAEGRDLREHLRRKYGDPEPMFQRVEAVAREVGLPLDFGKVRRMVPTLRAHALSARAVEKGTQRALMSDLFEAYFLEGRDVSAMDVLLELGERHGFSRDEVIALVEDPAAPRGDARRGPRHGAGRRHGGAPRHPGRQGVGLGRAARRHLQGRHRQGPGRRLTSPLGLARRARGVAPGRPDATRRPRAPS
jgi:predicted DsbA family dithiol-disulfide isomerase